MISTARLDSARYCEMREDLWNHYPQARAAMEEAAANLSDRPIDAAMLADHAGLFVEKPLYANMRAAKGGLGDRYSFMWRRGWFPTPAELAGPDWRIDQVGARRYEGRGAAVIAFQSAPPKPLGEAFPGKNQPRVALERLYRMRKIATRFDAALPAILAADAGFRGSQRADDFLKWMTPVLDAFDTGAMTTKFHAMTDLGFECIKPDLHAARTLAWFGQLRVRHAPAGDSGGEVNREAFASPLRYLQNHWNKCHVVSQGVALARSLAPGQRHPAFKGNACREVDIVLMQASLHGVIRKHA